MTKKKIVDKATLVDLGVDSLDTVAIVKKIEEDFDFHISDEDAKKLSTATAGEMIDYIQKRRNSLSPSQASLRD